ncbi:MAG: flagellar hook-basal body protein [Bacillota bacterium]|nr:flagellar hook-basal body protein [Bacillota bacterium]
MLRGLYTSGHGMKVQSKLNDITANNLANSQTVGFKKDTGVMTNFPEMLLYNMGDNNKMANPSHLPRQVGNLSTGVVLNDSIASIRVPGTFQETNNPLDVAIEGDGFFVVDFTPVGQELAERYTKQGNFKLNQEGMLVTVDGYAVQGEQGNIYIDGTNIEISHQGEIFVDGNLVDRLRLVTFNAEEGLEKTGHTMFMHTNPAAVVPANNIVVRQGFVEGSNVNPVAEMVRMIEVMRAYEANQKGVQSHDETLAKAVNEVGKV